MANATRSEKLDLRLTPEAKRVLNAAAQASRRSVSEFVLESALDRAQEALPDRQHFGLDAARWKAFLAALDAPPWPLPLKPRQRPGWRIKRSQKRLPAGRVEPKMLTIGQSFLCAVERALQHEFADRAPRGLRGSVQHPLCLRRQAQIEFLGSRRIGHDDFSWLTI